MYTEDVTVNYKGFQPSQSTDTKLKEMTDQLHNESPSESCLKAVFVRVGEKGYLGMVKIHSSVGSFFAKARGYDVETLSERLAERLRDQLNEWKTMRFTDEDNCISGCYGQTQ